MVRTPLTRKRNRHGLPAGCTSSGGRVQVLSDAAVFRHDVVTDVITGEGAESRRERETIVFARQSDGRLAAHIHLSPAPQRTD
jgi:hypothetical protein